MTDPVAAIADAVLYEGYILWPYRRSALKNQQRWTFGGVYPEAWMADGHDDDACEMRTDCLLRGPGDARVDVRVRFLHVVARQVARREADGLRFVDELTVGEERHLAWDEAREREVLLPGLELGALRAERRVPVDIPAGREEEELLGPAGERAGALVRSWQALQGTVDVSAEPLGEDVWRLRVRIVNATPFAGGGREEALRHTFVSCHTGLHAVGGEFVSLTDPPAELREAAEGCANRGTWPVLVGEDGECDTLLSSPIILSDYPRVAPESPGDLFDGGEIDQLLVLNILSLTDEEKREMADSDPRAREILQRTAALSGDELMSLHGAIRDWQVLR